MNYSGYESGKCVLVTGAAGFIGSNLVRRLAKDDWFIIGTDSLVENSDVRLKYARLAEWGIPKEEIQYNKLVVNRHIEKSSFIQLDLEDTANVAALFETYDIRSVCHLGGLVDVEASMEEPLRYVNTNLAGFVTVLDNSRKQDVEHVVFVSYLGDPGVSVLESVSRSCELIAEVYSRRYSLPTTGLRVGTVYGPWANPDSLPEAFKKDAIPTDAISSEKEAIPTDCIYIDDVLDGLELFLKQGPSCMLKKPKGAPLLPYRMIDMGSGKTSLMKGLAAFTDWYKEWYTGEHPRINVERIIVGRYPFPCSMTWKYVWNKHLEYNFLLSDNPDRLLKSLIVSDGFDMGLGLIQPEDWRVYVEQMCTVLKLKPPMRVFEVGCGAGAFLFPLYQKGITVGGVDFASNLIHMAKLAMPGCRFDVGNAKDFDHTVHDERAERAERADVVLSNSVFQYFDSLKVAEIVLLKMFDMAHSMVAVLNVPDVMTDVEEIEASRNALPVNVYEEMYNGLKHLYIERNWFIMMGKRAGWKVRVYSQQIPNYGKNGFRYNVVYKKVTTS